MPLGSVEPQDADTVVRFQSKLEGKQMEWIRVQQEDLLLAVYQRLMILVDRSLLVHADSSLESC